MPYIPAKDREALWGKGVENATSGELNYAITLLLLGTGPKCYEDYNRLIGVLECVKLEFYRRAVAPYEDKKKEENGDVY